MGLRESIRARRRGRVEEELREQIREKDSVLNANSSLFLERLAELELSLEDESWARIGLAAEEEFSREGLRKMVALARVVFLKNPLIRRAVNVQTYYVWGQGVQISAPDEDVNAILQRFLADRSNRRELTGHVARTDKERELQIAGNLFLVFHTTSTGRTKIRSFPLSEIDDVFRNPDDRNEVWFYKRRYTEVVTDELGRSSKKERIRLYPDLAYIPSPDSEDDGPGREDLFLGLSVDWDHPILHVKVGGTEGMRFGLPDFYAAIDWARAYKEFLEDCATILNSLARFAWKASTKGGKRAVSKMTSKLSTTLGRNTPESNPAATTGAAAVTGDGVDLTPIPKSGAHISADEGRQMRLMVSSATDIPDTILAGDADMGNLATAKTLDRPTELAMLDRQSLWLEVFREVVDKVILEAVRVGELEGEVLAEDDGERVDVPLDRDYSVDISFPPILEHDMKSVIDAITIAATLDGKGEAGTIPRRQLVRLLLTTLGVDEVEKILEANFPEGDDTLPENSPEDPAQTEAEGVFVEAVREIAEALRREKVSA